MQHISIGCINGRGIPVALTVRVLKWCSKYALKCWTQALSTGGTTVFENMCSGGQQEAFNTDTPNWSTDARAPLTFLESTYACASQRNRAMTRCTRRNVLCTGLYLLRIL